MSQAEVLAESAFQITNPGVATKPCVARSNKVVKYTFAGFRPGRPIFGHFQSGGTLVLTLSKTTTPKIVTGPGTTF